MKISFNIDYRTNWGESVFVTGSIPALGNGAPDKAVRMVLEGDSRWHLNIDILDKDVEIDYHYIVRHENGFERHEWGPKHHLSLSSEIRDLYVSDLWQDQPWDKPFYSSAFVDCIFERKNKDNFESVLPSTLVIETSAPTIAPDEVLAICGNIPVLGSWDPSKALVMNDSRYPYLTISIPLQNVSMPLEYKFLILKKNTGELVAWEGGDNRRLNMIIPETIKRTAIVVAGLRLRCPKTPWKGAGVAIPVFSLRSDDDFGVGDFYDLMMMADWAAVTGQKFIQLLPINDTTMTNTWTDSYPYNANSTFALHPMYLRLSAMGHLRDEERQHYYDSLGHKLNQLETVDYEKVNSAKRDFTRELFKEQGKETLESEEYKKFVKINKFWLLPYAAFCVLRDKFKTPDMAQWGEFSEYSEDVLERVIDENHYDIEYWCYIQFHLDRQMRHVRDYAHSLGVALKGDIPIGISRNSVDAWISPKLFNLNSQAGAPPDDFSVLGQNWGFPTYNWEEMARDGFAWWKSRFRKMAEYFDAYRIDHVLGFFRIWQIPMDALHGLLGIFNPALPFTPDELKYSYDFWIDIDLQTRPYVMDYFLGDFFGPWTDEVKQNFLLDAGYGRYHLRPEFDTQRKVAEYFASQDKNEKNDRICNGLLGLIDQVLFIEDPYEKGKYHPRISAQHTYIYRALTDYEKWCFNRLYNDFYYHRHNDFWYGKAMWKLPPLLDATNMLVCAEDLGMIPDCVPAVMNRLEMLSLEIQRMPKDPKQTFGDTWNYPYYSVCTTSTHDMGGIRQWWEENREATQRFYNEVLHEPGEAPFYAEPWICDKIIKNHLQSPSMLCILPLQDWLSIDSSLRRQDPRDEQINVPAISRHYWRYRMHLTLERLIGDSDFSFRLHQMIAESGR